jgi:glycosyltransferase involved in cell wall biosynthesis
MRRIFSRWRPLQIVIDARMADGQSGGVQQWVIGLAAALSRLDDGTEAYRFLVSEGRGDWLAPYLGGRCSALVYPAQLPAEPPGPTMARAVRRRRRGLGPRLRVLRRLRRLIPTKKPVHVVSPFDRWLREAVADVMHFTRQSASKTTVPSIYQPWDLQHLHLPEFFSPETLKARDVTYRAFCAQASLIVVATRWVRDDVAAQYGIAVERIAVVNPPPVTASYVPPTAQEEAAIAARLGLPARYAFYPAQTWGHKNHERLFEALGRLRDRGIEVPLVCSGHRSDRYATLMRLAAALDIERLVIFVGFLSATEIQVVYRRATCLVFPSLYEGWGLPILEAFAADLPVACSNVTSLPDLVGDAGLVFDPTDPEAIAIAIERLWVDDGLRAQLAERGRARANQFDWHRTALIMRAHYRRLGGRRLDAGDVGLLAAEPLV